MPIPTATAHAPVRRAPPTTAPVRALPKLRIILRQLHLWLGLTLGALFALLGLTGSALVFYVEIDAALNPAVQAESVAPAPGWASPVWDRALATGRARWPDPAGAFHFEVTGEGGAIPARYYPPTHLSGHHTPRTTVWFSPDGSRILRAEPWGRTAMSFIYEIHMNLLAGDTGMLIVGWSGFVILLLLASGLVVWWPRGSWGKALAFRRDAVPLRRLRDLHKHSGLWSLVFLILLALTGALLALPAIKDPLLTATIAAPDPLPAPLSTRDGGRQITIGQALAAARRAMPDARLAFILVPGKGADPFRIRVQVPGEPHRRFPKSSIFVDQYLARVLAVHDVREGNAATLTDSWIRPIHDGSLAGLPTRILAVIAGCVPAALFVTGLLHWRRRRVARRHPHHAAASHSAPQGAAS